MLIASYPKTPDATAPGFGITGNRSRLGVICVQHRHTFARHIPVKFESKLFVVYRIHNGSDKTKTAGKKIKQSHAGLFYHKTLYPRNEYKTEYATK
jgi:hypothetical protein